ncbi:hypothetical protein [Xanthomonas sp. BRIP62409]|uniref:hypothetical protein n=1 Tax=Xanthomonas sp. BRIP62409 TaxID=2182388 RepID=UPI000F8D75D7|nr:hypothetical protein [Xanthomonas sp. BRIP62409]
MIVTDAHSRVQLQSLCAPMPGTHAIARVLLVAPPVATVYMRVGDVLGGMYVLALMARRLALKQQRGGTLDR